MALEVSLSNPQNFLIHYRSKTVPTIAAVAFLALGAVVIGILAILALPPSHLNLAPLQNIGIKGAIALTAGGVTFLLATISAAALIVLGQKSEARAMNGLSGKADNGIKTVTQPNELKRIENWTNHPFVQEIVKERNNKGKEEEGPFFESKSLNELLAFNYSEPSNLPEKPKSLDKGYDTWEKEIKKLAEASQLPAVFASDKEEDIKDQMTILLLTDEELGALSLDAISKFTPFQKLALMQRLTIASQLQKTSFCFASVRVETTTLAGLRSLVKTYNWETYITNLKNQGLLYLLGLEQIYNQLLVDIVAAKDLLPIGNEIEQAYTKEKLEKIMLIKDRVAVKDLFLIGNEIEQENLENRVLLNRNAICKKLSQLPKEYAPYLPPKYTEWYNSPERTALEKWNSLKPLEI